MFNRIIVVVLDSVGVGELPDAKDYDDLNTNTFMHATENQPILENFKNIGYYNLACKSKYKTISYYTKSKEESNGKDSLTGHLEMMGVVTKKPFKVFMNGFPKKLISEIERISNRKVIGNKVASGTEIIKELGEKHMKTGDLIVYTSADSVLQIAAHEEVVPLDELDRICTEIRKITMTEEWKVGRIISRPFIGTNKDDFIRTPNRHDYALNPAYKTELDYLKENDYEVISIGKISDIFNNCGITRSVKVKDNLDGINTIINALKFNFKGLCFANLNDYDSKYGHRRDKEGYYNALKLFNDRFDDIVKYLRYDDLLIITADHGNDPTHKGTDHTREYVPIVFYSKKLTGSGKIPDLNTFASIGATIAENFNVPNAYGESVLNKLK